MPVAEGIYTIRNLETGNLTGIFYADDEILLEYEENPHEREKV
jgi:hypothetical protein